MKIVWSPAAADEFDATIGYLAERNPQAARKLAEGVLAAIDRLAAEPLDGRASAVMNPRRELSRCV